MERLIAWYRVGSSVGAVVALVVANAIPLFGVLFLGWNVWTILTIYWLENGVVGIFNVLKMAKAAGPEPTGRAAMLYNGRPVIGGAAAQGDPHPVLLRPLRHLLGRPRHLRPDPAAVPGVRRRERRDRQRPAGGPVRAHRAVISHWRLVPLQLHRARRVPADERQRTDERARTAGSWSCTSRSSSEVWPSR